MKTIKRNFYKRGIAVLVVCLVLFVTPFMLAKCTKKGESQNPKDRELTAFTGSGIYRDFIKRNTGMGRVDVDASRIVNIDNTAATVHIPIMRHKDIAGAIIGVPLGARGKYELMYQDNRAALSGTGNIYLYTSANELFARIYLKNGSIKDIEPNNSFKIPGSQHSSARIDCGYWCRVKECYAHIKTVFPGELVCDLLDLFMGVCSSASFASCLVRAAKS